VDSFTRKRRKDEPQKIRELADAVARHARVRALLAYWSSLRWRARVTETMNVHLRGVSKLFVAQHDARSSQFQ